MKGEGMGAAKEVSRATMFSIYRLYQEIENF